MSPAITGLAGPGVPISFAMLFTGFWGLCFYVRLQPHLILLLRIYFQLFHPIH